MKKYLDDLKYILDHGTPRSDRTSTGTHGVFGLQTRYDLTQGFPAVTTKKLAWRSVVSELLWMIEGSGDERRLAEILHGTRDPSKSTIWSANAQAAAWQPRARFSGDLQKVYGRQWRQWNCYDQWTRNVVLVAQGHDQGRDAPYLPDETSGKPAAGGRGFRGTIEKSSSYLVAAYRLWSRIMRSTGSDYVDQPWRCFSNFYRDIHELVGFDQWLADPQGHYLDNQYHGCGYYGKKSTIFLPNRYRIAPGQTALYRFSNSQTHETMVMTDPNLFNAHSVKNWTVTVQPAPNGYAWRQRFYVDQLADLVAGITHDPSSRRHVLTAWNPADINDMALPPCHVMSQFYVTEFTSEEIHNLYFEHRKKLDPAARQALDHKFEGRKKTLESLRAAGLPTAKLSCQLYQRSADMFLGVPFNIASYSLLTHMIAQCCNLMAWEFIHVIGDAHIYVDHLAAVQEQLTRSPGPSPILKLNPNIKDITKFTMDDVMLENYQPASAITAKMSV